MLRPIPTSNKTSIPKTGRRGSLPTDSTTPGGKVPKRIANKLKIYIYKRYILHNIKVQENACATMRKPSFVLVSTRKCFILPHAEASFAYKWMHVFPYSEDDSIISIKRRSSGGPELFAAAQQKLSSTVSNVRTWKAQILIEQMSSSTTAATSSCGYWPGRRRGSLPVDVYIASSGSCSSESESSG